MHEYSAYEPAHTCLSIRRGDTRTQACAWSRALTTAWSRAYCAITIIINGV